jgi:hypothetical protein
MPRFSAGKTAARFHDFGQKLKVCGVWICRVRINTITIRA